ncbi:hypothetical protein [Klebsiella quasipneumoniae]|uniref:hypothetical protein n=1 Tax=Klebsiella quasipneumoniae TaxID=1463165 RepID=UPI00249A63DF|nr:hypothetical protein [Klebsiella quasipneumoniae]MDI3084850.1 hypothetical protein [Klebsiella quasipneumoniae]
MNIETVNELIQSLESAGEPSIREQKFLKLAKAYQQLAAENVALKTSIPPMKMINDVTDSWDDVSLAEEVGFNRAISAIMKNIPETPTTDRIVAGIKADGVEEFAAKLRIPGDDQFFDALAKGVALAADDFAKQLREGADK